MRRILTLLLVLTWAPPLAAGEPSPLARLAAAPVTVDGVTLDAPRLARFYGLAGDAPVWVDARRREAALEFLSRADRDGLHPPDYAVVPLALRLARGEHAAVETELLLTHALLHYVRDIKTGRDAPARLEPPIFVNARDVDAPVLLAAAVTAPSLTAALEALAPQTPEYRRLREALASYRAYRSKGGFTPVPPGPALRPGARGPRVTALRTRLIEERYLAAATEGTFDAEAVAALERFQANHGLAADGALGPKTVKALNEPLDHHIGDLVLNLERWRWLPDDLGARHIRVNIAGFWVRAYEGGREALRMRAVVGKPARMTPVFSSVVTDLIFQPHWSVPERIAREDLLPKLRADPAMLAAEGFTVLGRDAAGKLAPVTAPVDWRAVPDDRPFPFLLRQEPGPYNALGQVRFSIRNEWDIYMHGTPAKGLFELPERAFSSGCIRLERPLELVYFVMQGAPGYDRARIDRLYYRDVSAEDAQPAKVPLARPIPVHIVYWTAWADEDGSVHFVDDVYGRDAALANALHMHE